ncbi:unnamed protein product [Vitrella brassicaformis CCMP3155]|uniref:Intimal thickness related receptor IRP domain-containing protein n=1 Tax=Vitrella brassicaformis (strain CCMP3155) TaxID=1169540 RepID=A0A0G4G3I1_VITBC|nr:unnamed protein product [Vitrella brassicaformis CCMP3155]|eukprot:CEM22713.1 unnamed protein product [Vitrella brassicaformis CCMP3155]
MLRFPALILSTISRLSPTRPSSLRPSTLFLVLLLRALDQRAIAKKVTGQSLLSPRTGKIEGKFCYDYSLDPALKPGLFRFQLTPSAPLTSQDRLYVLLFDDQWQSFPQADATWAESSCEDKLLHARWEVQFPSPRDFLDDLLMGPEGLGLFLPLDVLNMDTTNTANVDPLLPPIGDDSLPLKVMNKIPPTAPYGGESTRRQPTVPSSSSPAPSTSSSWLGWLMGSIAGADKGSQAGEIMPLKMDVNVTEKSQPRYWYAAVLSCGQRPVEYSVKISFENPLQGWKRELGIDEHGVLGFSVVFTLCALLTALLVTKLLLHGHDLAADPHISQWIADHRAPAAGLNALQRILSSLPSPPWVTMQPTTWGRDGCRLWLLLGLSVWSGVFAGLMVVHHWVWYAADGVGSPLAKQVALTLFALSRVALILILMRIADGLLGSDESTPILRSAAEGPLLGASYAALSTQPSQDTFRDTDEGTGPSPSILPGPRGYGVRSLGSSAVDIYGSVPGLIYVTLSGVWYLCYQDLLLHSYAHSTSTGPGRHADTLAGTLLGFWFLVLPVSLLLVRLAPRWHQLKLFTAANHMALIACWNGIATLLASSRVRGMLADRRSVCTFFSPAKSDKAVSRLDDGADDTRVIDFMSVSNPFKP